MKNLCIFGYPNCASEDSDQTVLMRRLIWIFTGRKLSKVRFPTLWFKRLEIVEITELDDIFLQALLAWKKKKKKKKKKRYYLPNNNNVTEFSKIYF